MPPLRVVPVAIPANQQALRERGFTGPDSATNFLFVTTSRMPCKQIFERLRQKGVLIRYFSAPRLSDYLRITIGTRPENDTLLEALKNYKEEEA